MRYLLFSLMLVLVLVGCSESSNSSPQTRGAEDTTPATPDGAEPGTPDTVPLPGDDGALDVPSDAPEPPSDPGTPPADVGGTDTQEATETSDTTVADDTDESGDAEPADTAAPTDTGPVDDPPAACEAACPEGTVCNGGSCGTKICDVAAFDSLLFDQSAAFSEQLLRSEQPDQTWAPSKIYQWADLLQGLYTACIPGVGGFKFWAGDPNGPPELQWKYAAVNLAAFLAQSMKETIKYDVCDENNWDNANGYPLAGACGQLGQKYEDYDCDMSCPKVPELTTWAVTSAKWYGAPGPMFCAPDSALISAGLSTDGSTGFWNYGTDCWPYPATEPGFEVDTSVPPWLRPECEVYVGQKGGKYDFDGSSGSVEGCCWWGRGVIQTTGRCNFGRLNHYLGQTHLDPASFPPPTSVPYPEVDFCKDPEVICASTEHPELKWIAGLFYWANSVQTYDVDGWAYTAQLQAWIDGGLQGHAFIDAVSGIVNRGCHNPPCATGPVDGLEERRANFEKALTVMGLKP